MINRKTPDLENKLLALFAIEELGPLTNLQLLQFLAELDLMDYITMQLILGEMMESGHLQMAPHAMGGLYTLSFTGKENMSMFLHRLPHSIQQQVKEAAVIWKPRFQREMQMMADFNKQEDGAYALRLRLMEKNAPLLDMTLRLPSRDLADQLSRRWSMAASPFYGFLMKTLGDDFTATTLISKDLPKDAYIRCQDSGQGCILHLQYGKTSSPVLVLDVCLPSDTMAHFFASRWDMKAGAVYSFLMDALAQEE